MKVDTGYASIWITVYFACLFFSRTYLVLHLILMFKWSVCPSESRFANAKKCQETNVLCFNVGKKQNQTVSAGFNANIYALAHRASNPSS
jgi:hypothetical protein